MPEVSLPGSSGSGTGSSGFVVYGYLSAANNQQALNSGASTTLTGDAYTGGLKSTALQTISLKAGKVYRITLALAQFITPSGSNIKGTLSLISTVDGALTPTAPLAPMSASNFESSSSLIDKVYAPSVDTDIYASINTPGGSCFYSGFSMFVQQLN